MRKIRPRNVLAAAAIAAAAVAAGVLAAGVYSYWQGQAAYDEVAQVAFGGASGGEDADSSAGSDGISDGVDLSSLSLDWDALASINPDVVGWVCVPGTVINYPVVHSSDNQEYLYYNFNGQKANGLQATYGTPFLMAQNAADLSDPVNIIQAHNMANGTMFAEISTKLLASAEEFNSHRTAYVLSPTRSYRCQTIAIVTCSSTDPLVRTSFSSTEEFTEYVRQAVSRSVLTPDPAGPDPEDVEKIFILSTCTNGGKQRCLLFCAVTEWVDVGGGDGA